MKRHVFGLLVGCLVACGSPGEGGPAASAQPSSTHALTASASASASSSPVASASASVAATDPQPPAVFTLKTEAGEMVFHPVHHATLWFEVDGKVVWVDPWSKGKLDDAPKADFILLTDIHADHFDPDAISKLSKDDTVVMGPRAVSEQLAKVQVIANGEQKKLGPLEVTAVPMYNEKRGPEAGKLYHDKGRGNGYLLGFGGKRVYLSGDTECTSEMKALEKIDLAFVCMNLPYTMPPSEAAECIAAFKPRTLIPYHYRDSDPGELDAKLKDSGVEIVKLPFY